MADADPIRSFRADELPKPATTRTARRTPPPRSGLREGGLQACETFSAQGLCSGHASAGL